MSVRVRFTLVCIAVGGFALSGCTPAGGDPGATASPTGSASASPSPSSSPSSSSPTASPSPSSDGSGTALDVSCLDLVSLDTMYRFDPNFGLDDSYSPAAGTPAAAAVTDSGLACGWVQQTNGEIIEIAAAQPSTSALAKLKAAAGGQEFATSGGTGTVQRFSGPYWVVATSSYFTSAVDAAPLVDSAVAALG